MTYNREVLKAIKECLKPYGFKYKKYAFEKTINPQLTVHLLFSMENHFRPHYFYVGMGVLFISSRLNEILYEVTDGKTDLREKTGPICVRTYSNMGDIEEIHSEFDGDKDMEDNIKRFEAEFTERVLPVIQWYQTERELFAATICEDSNEHLGMWAFYYIPIVYYIQGEYAKAIQYIDDFLIREKELNSKRPNIEYEERIDIFESYKKNLLNWIENKKPSPILLSETLHQCNSR